MKLELKRTWKSDRSTIGKLFIDGKFFCYTLEDIERPVKVAGQTAIPKGTYKVIISYSPRFKQLMPLLLNVPNFLGIRIHWGNVPEHTEGCLLVGKTKSKDFIGNSRIAYKELMKVLNKANKKEAIVITIT